MPRGIHELRLLTRAQLLSTLKAAGVLVTEHQLVYWEKVGALPRTVIQKHEGMPQATYPTWYASVVARALELRGHGTPFRAMRADLRAYFDVVRQADQRQRPDVSVEWGPPADGFPPELPPELARTIREFAAHLNGEEAMHITVATLQFHDQGNPDLAYTFLLSPNGEAEER